MNSLLPELDKINYVANGISVYIDAMINAHHVNSELLWLRIRQEADYQLELLREADSPTE